MLLIEEQQAVTENKSLVLLSHKTLQMDSTVAGYFWNDVPPWRKVKTDKVLKSTGHCIRGRPGLRNIPRIDAANYDTALSVSMVSCYFFTRSLFSMSTVCRLILPDLTH